MSGSGKELGTEETPKKPASLAKRLLMLAIGMSAFAYAMLSTNKFVIPGLIVALSIFEVIGLVKGFKESKMLEALCEVVYFIVLLALGFGASRALFAGHWGVIWVTIFYRPQYTVYRNQRLAFALGLLIMAVTLPITLGIVTDPSAVALLTTMYGLLVAGLWLFCSKLGAWVLRSAAG